MVFKVVVAGMVMVMDAVMDMVMVMDTVMEIGGIGTGIGLKKRSILSPILSA
jgi:hypothetical protein